MQNETLRNKNPSTADKLTYDEQKDQFLCPIGEPMKHTGWTIVETKGGYAQSIDKYQAQNCEGCFLKGTCHQQEGNRTIEISLNKPTPKTKRREALKE